jgi:hypothetical protein
VNPFLSRELASEHIRDLCEETARAGRSRGAERSHKSDAAAAISIRRFAEPDRDAVRRLAALDEKRLSTCDALVAELAGELVAALPLDGGPALADPFKPTADVVGLLRLRAHQLRKSNGPQRPRWLPSKPRIGVARISPRRA